MHRVLEKVTAGVAFAIAICCVIDYRPEFLIVTPLWLILSELHGIRLDTRKK